MQDDDVTKITGMGQFEILNPTVYQAKWEAVAKEINKILGMEGFGTFVPCHGFFHSQCPDGKFRLCFPRYFFNNNCWRVSFPTILYGGSACATLLIIW